MEIEVLDREIRLDRVTSVLDDFVLDFLELLKKQSIRYVIISGYVVLLFGRARITEDVDIFLEELDENKLKKLYDSLQKDYWLINAGSFDTAKALYDNGDAWRVSKKNQLFPNMEIKKPKTEFDFVSLNNPTKVILNKKYEINISPMELQIAYKLFLGSQKDLEDARYLYDIFKDKLDKIQLEYFVNKLNVTKKSKELVR